MSNVQGSAIPDIKVWYSYTEAWYSMDCEKWTIHNIPTITNESTFSVYCTPQVKDKFKLIKK